MLDREGFRGPADATVAGDEATVERKIRRYAGATDLLAIPFGSAAERTRTSKLLAVLR